jgi:hypothetical protein
MKHIGTRLSSTVSPPADYLDFVRAKIITLPPLGTPIAAEDVNPLLHRHQPVLVKWLVEGGRRALFANFGLGKTMIQLETMRITVDQVAASSSYAAAGFPIGLIVIPLTVVTEFKRDADKLGIGVLFVRTTAEILAAFSSGYRGLYLTNYESVRDGKIDTSILTAVSLDEASCLRGFGGTKTFREFMRLFDGVRFKFVATATPAPNEYVELLAYAAFLEVMDVGQAKTRFFKRNSEEADDLTLHPHKEEEFWLWVNSWAAFIQRPSDLGFSDDGYELPPLDVRWHEVASDHARAGADKGGQGLLLKQDAIGVIEASREKRESLPARIGKLMELRAEDPDAHRVIWHDLEAERQAIEAAIPSVTSIWGSGARGFDSREDAIIAFSDGKVQELATKPVLAGSGCNFQRHCAWAVFLGIGFKFNDFIQAVHRIQRFLQTKQVRIDLIHSEAERAVRRVLEDKWKRHDEMCARMSEIIRKYGLGLAGAADVLERSVEDGLSADVATSDLAETRPNYDGGADWQVFRNDTILQTRQMQSDCVGLCVTSIPFGSQYEYSPSYNDLGHTDDLDHFFAQLDYLTPELLRTLMPGRRLEVHVKDRVVPSGLTGLGFRTIEPFHARCIEHYTRHGFAYLGMTTIVTDVVRENAGTYRLGWTEQLKDSSGMGCGLPEYLLHFRKPPSDRSNGYADVPVTKDRPMIEVIDTGEVIPWDNDLVKRMKARPVPGTGYSRARWQTDAAGMWRSDGNRVLEPADLVGMKWDNLYQLFRGWSYGTIYNHDGHVALMEAMEAAWSLPTDFALMPVQSGHPEVWTDVARMLGANTMQSAKGREAHLCPLPFDIVDRAIKNWSNPGDLVYDPFGGLMTVPMRAVKHGRRGAAVELNPGYFADGVKLLREQDAGRATPDLFALLDMIDGEPAGVPLRVEAA